MIAKIKNIRQYTYILEGGIYMVKKIVVLVIVIIIILVGIIINWSSLYKNDIYDVSEISESIIFDENVKNEVNISNVIEQEETESKKKQ